MMKVKNILLMAFVAFLPGLSPCLAQADEYQIKWIAQFPTKEGKKKQGLGEKISRVVFGKRPQAVVKPFSIVADNPEHFWILDQGAGSVFELEDGVTQSLKAVKKADGIFPSLVGLCKGPEGVPAFHRFKT